MGEKSCYREINVFLTKNLNASSLDRLSIPPVRRENVKTFRWDHGLPRHNLFMTWHINGFPDGSNIGSNVGEKPTVILYTYINRHAGTPDKAETML